MSIVNFEIKRKGSEDIESLLSRFKFMTKKSRIVSEIKERASFESDSQKLRRKKRAAIRNYKKNLVLA